MYASRKLPATVEGLETLNFAKYWDVIQQNVTKLYQLGPIISAHQQKLGVTVYNLQRMGRQDLIELLQDEIRKTEDDLQKWWKVKETLDKYLPEWTKAAQGDGAPVVNSLSALPLILGAAAIAAAAYVVTQGMALVQQYWHKKDLTQAVIEKKITSGQAAEILTVTETPGGGIIQRLTSGVGTNIGAAAVIGFGIWLIWRARR